MSNEQSNTAPRPTFNVKRHEQKKPKLTRDQVARLLIGVAQK